MKGKYKITKTLTSVFAFFLIFTLVIGYGFAEVKTSDAKEEKQNSFENAKQIKWLNFSSTNYSHERNLVRKHERVPASEVKYARIYIALEDLNDDGIKEIFAYIESSYYCGREVGCPLNIYRVKNGKLISLLSPKFKNGFPLFIEVDNIGKQNMIRILPNKTMGWHDIAIDKLTVWKWNGKSY